MHLIDMVRLVQIPLLAAMLLGGCVTKFVRAARVGSLEGGFGPTALAPMRLRRPLAVAMCALELGLGVGLILTAGRAAGGAPADCVRLGTALLFLVATCALLELRAAKPDIGCGCFGDFSSSPVSYRTMIRSALLAVAALTTLGLHAPLQPHPGAAAATTMLGILAAELAVIAGLSPELGEALVRLGYSEPCELRVLPAERTLAALRRSRQWRRYAGMITTDEPADVWRELCWRYLVFPGRYGDREAEVVFAVFLRQRRPLIHAALVDAVTGKTLPPWLAPPAGTWPAWPFRRRAQAAAPLIRPEAPSVPAATPAAQAGSGAGDGQSGAAA